MKVPLDIRRSNGHVSAWQRSQPPAVLVLLLACGHPWAFFDEAIQVSEVSGYLWRCEECGAHDQEALRVLGCLSDEKCVKLFDDEEAWESWFASIDPRSAATQNHP